jgi:hypothetical protein
MRHQETPAAEHLEFDRLCRGLEDFEPLPSRAADREEERTDSDAPTHITGSFDPLILAGLVNPV